MGSRPTPASTPTAARPAAGSTPPQRPAASSTVLAKQKGVEGRLNKATGKFDTGAFSAAEKSRYSSVAAQNAAKSSAASATPKPSSPTPAASAPKPPTPAVGMLGKTSFERRTPTAAELSGAQGAPAGSTPEQRLQAAQKKTFGAPTTGPSPAIPNASSIVAAGTNSTPRDMSKYPIKPATPGINNTKQPGKTVNNSYEWPSEKEIRDIAGAYSSIYEAKKKEYDASRDKDEDGDNDFADNMIARMVASGMSREEATKKVKNKSYNKEEYSLDEETKAEKEARIAARRARVKEMEKEGAVMTSSRRTSEVARQRKEDKKAEALERAASAILNQMHGATGRVSERPMGSQAPKTKEKAPDATRRLNPNLRKDNLGSAADRVLKSIKKEEVELWVNELLEEGYDLSEYTWDDMFDIYEATRMRKELGREGEIATRNQLAARSNAHQRSGSVDKTIAAAERLAGRPYVKPVRGESESDYNQRLQRSSDTMSKLAASRRGSVRDKPRAGLRGYAAKNSDKELHDARRSAMAAGTLTPREKKMLNREAYAAYEFVASYLLENNFATTVEDADVIINNMSENWFESIIEDAPMRPEPLWGNKPQVKKEPPMRKEPLWDGPSKTTTTKPPVKKEPAMRTEPLF